MVNRIPEKKGSDSLLFFKKTVAFAPLVALILFVNCFLNDKEQGLEKKFAQHILNGCCLNPEKCELTRSKLPFFKPFFNQRLFERFLIECAASAFSGPFDRAQDGVSELKNIKFPTHRGFPDACVGEPQGFTKAKDVIVLGSSRSQHLSFSPYLKTYTSFFNHSMCAAVMKDFIALYGLYKKTGHRLPSVVVIECSGFHLNANYKQNTDFWAIKDGYEYLVRHNVLCSWSESISALATRIVDTFSCELFQKIIKNSVRKMFYTHSNQSKEARSFSVDGKRTIPQPTPADVLQSVKTLTIFNEYDNFTELDSSIMNQVEVFIQTLLSDNVRVILFLPPYHPITYSYLKRNPIYSVVFDAQAYFVACAKKYNVEVFGSYNPHDCACDESDFCDWHHPFDSSTPKIFKTLLHTL